MRNMRVFVNSKWLLFLLFIANCLLNTNARGGRGVGGGGRGSSGGRGGSRGSSRGSSSSSRGSSYIGSSSYSRGSSSSKSSGSYSRGSSSSSKGSGSYSSGSSSSSKGSGSYSSGSSSSSKGSGSYSSGSSSSSKGSSSYSSGSSSSSTGSGGYSSGSSSSSTGSGGYPSGLSSFTGYSSSSKGSSSSNYPGMTDVNDHFHRLASQDWNVKPPEMSDFSYLALGRARKPDYPGSGSYSRGSSTSSIGYGSYSRGSSSSATGSGGYSSGLSSFSGYSSSSKGSSSSDYPRNTDVNDPFHRLASQDWNVKPPEMSDINSLKLYMARKRDYPEKSLINSPKTNHPGLTELRDFSYLNTGRIQKPDFPSLTNYPERTFANYPKLGSTPEFNYPKLPETSNFNSRNRGSIRITSARGSSNRISGIRNGRGRGSSNRRGTFRSTNVTAGNYPRQPGAFQRPGGIPGANYPRQTYTSYPANSLGSNVWSPQSGKPAPAYMNYGGLPTGANMYTKPEKKKGFLGSLMSMGTPKNKKNKYFGSQPSPYTVRDLEGGFLGKHGSKAAMYTIFPYMGAKKSSKLFKPRFRPSSFHRHHYHYGHYGHSDHYDIYNNDYAGSCNRPIAPKNGEIVCHATPAEVGCYVTCDKGYLLPSNTTTSKCWHVTGIWNPVKNFPDCKPVCDKTCLNGGSCIGPDVCGCPPEYKGPRCEFYSLNCDIRKLTNDIKISWVCTQSNNETSCRVKCKTPFEFETPTEEVYKCSQDGVWTPPTIPECILPDMAATTTENLRERESENLLSEEIKKKI